MTITSDSSYATRIAKTALVRSAVNGTNSATISAQLAALTAALVALGDHEDIVNQSLQDQITALTNAINAGLVYSFSQPVPASVWIWTHNLGRRLAGVQIFDMSWNVLLSDIQENTVNQITITFLDNMAGYVMAV